MATMTATSLLERLSDFPELRAELRDLLNEEANANYPKRKPSNKARDLEIAKRVWAGESRRTLAQEYGIGLPRVHQIMAMNPNPDPTPKAHPNAARDAEIVAMAQNKISRAVIAKSFGLSLIRIHQIIGAEPKSKYKTITLEDKIKYAMQKYDSFEPLTFEEEWRVFVRKYETIARQVASDLLNGMSQYQIEQKYPSDCTGADLALTFMHYRNAYLYFVDESTNAWKR